ncbi:uncharacterized protein Z519_10907 [Cladophialophora bantiana CBS 173.52]|uniref:BZIP domain-containing protein n=1 Tax=Cladophialophora bantiana (strain ATCC 10958 / CBS 173.52 / CDC B-1940 / NIH 8579) TaxID=1442370 RepID=A0A0D2HUX8_CLAB1|nr:uncharacterized protein Z519_10907 [Cladophialophora bantiana CBS 173.52]KIW88339.1 hypothetical protein Z519_10907 [Cladophialophora bantiana CBS 173.52]
MSRLTQRAAPSTRHSQPSTSVAPGFIPNLPPDLSLNGDNMDHLFNFDPFRHQDLGEWSRQAPAENMWQQDHGLFDGCWSLGAVTGHQFTSPMSISEQFSQSHPKGGSTPTYPADELPYGLRLDYNEDDGTQDAGAVVTQRRERERSEADDSNSIGDNSFKEDSASEQKRRMQNRQAQRAFRERKVKYVQDLEKQVKDLLLYAESLKHENQMLRARGQWLSSQLKNFHRQASKRSPL